MMDSARKWANWNAYGSKAFFPASSCLNHVNRSKKKIYGQASWFLKFQWNYYTEKCVKFARRKKIFAICVRTHEKVRSGGMRKISQLKGCRAIINTLNIPLNSLQLCNHFRISLQLVIQFVYLEVFLPSRHFRYSSNFIYSFRSVVFPPPTCPWK